MLALSPNSKIAVVCRGGPENGPFSAQAFLTASKGLEKAKIPITAIYANSGAVPTALIGCYGEIEKLCSVWRDIRPRDIVGGAKESKAFMRHIRQGIYKSRAMLRLIGKESVFSGEFLDILIRKHCNFKKVFAPSAIKIVIPAVDEISGKLLLFTNKNPKHWDAMPFAARGSMALTPFLPPVVLGDCDKAGLLEDKEALLSDGAFKANLPLEQALYDSCKFDVIIIIDVHGLKLAPLDFNQRNHWATHLRRNMHILINDHDEKELQMFDRVNEEMRVLGLLQDLKKKLPAEDKHHMEGIIERMKSGPLGLADKKVVERVFISDHRYSTLFNFASFTQKETMDLMMAGHYAALNMLKSLRIPVDGLEQLRPAA
ncbi:patatin-like phospholipase family protein [Candidatus Parcubacteria bacterium]|nr:patatin-like phospholipase family protein [Candidatus Parcubacteria bacterium]